MAEPEPDKPSWLCEQVIRQTESFGSAIYPGLALAPGLPALELLQLAGKTPPGNLPLPKTPLMVAAGVLAWAGVYGACKYFGGGHMPPLQPGVLPWEAAEPDGAERSFNADKAMASKETDAPPNTESAATEKTSPASNAEAEEAQAPEAEETLPPDPRPQIRREIESGMSDARAILQQAIAAQVLTPEAEKAVHELARLKILLRIVATSGLDLTGEEAQMLREAFPAAAPFVDAVEANIRASKVDRQAVGWLKDLIRREQDPDLAEGRKDQLPKLFALWEAAGARLIDTPQPRAAEIAKARLELLEKAGRSWLFNADWKAAFAVRKLELQRIIDGGASRSPDAAFSRPSLSRSSAKSQNADTSAVKAQAPADLVIEAVLRNLLELRELWSTPDTKAQWLAERESRWPSQEEFKKKYEAYLQQYKHNQNKLDELIRLALRPVTPETLSPAAAARLLTKLSDMMSREKSEFGRRSPDRADPHTRAAFVEAASKRLDELEAIVNAPNTDQAHAAYFQQSLPDLQARHARLTRELKKTEWDITNAKNELKALQERAVRRAELEKKEEQERKR